MLWIITTIVSYSALSVAATIAVVYVYAAFSFLVRTQYNLIGFLHPASGAGGGGERVLWVTVQHLLKSNSSLQVALYTSEFPKSTNNNNTHHHSNNHPNSNNRNDNNNTNNNYSSKTDSDDHLLSNLVPKQFGISLTRDERARLHIHYIPLQQLQDPNFYPVGRLFLQSIVGGVALYLGTICNILLIDTHSPVPDYFIDTVGIPFSYFWFRATGLWCLLRGIKTKVGCYVHYPYISTDMIDSVQTERVMPNNPLPAKGLKKMLKLRYYSLMVFLYRWFAGFFVNGAITCNSTWTRNHIKKVWGPTFFGGGGEAAAENGIKLLFPPVNAERFKKFDLDEKNHNDTNDGILLISVGQFRPEKDHPLLLRSFARALKKLQQQEEEARGGGNNKNNDSSDSITKNIKLRIIGGARNQEDKDRADKLLKDCSASSSCSSHEFQTDISKNVEFCINAPFDQLEESFRRASIGLHTMRDEHFGIVVVEYMASGCITIANNSAGPAEIVTNGKTGYLCSTEEEYAQKIFEVIQEIRKMNNNNNNNNNSSSSLMPMRNIQLAARSASSKYGDEGFGENFEKIFLLKK